MVKIKETHFHTQKTMISFIGAFNYESEIFHEGEKPVLVACLHRGEGFRDQVRVLKSMHKSLGEEVKICLIHEDFMTVFMKIHGVIGTPTYLIIEAGKEKDRILGETDKETLISELRSGFNRVTLKTGI